MELLRKLADNGPLLFVTLLVLVLDFAALDDITTGSETSYWAEWDMLLFSAVIFGLIYYSLSRSRTPEKIDY